MNRHTRVIFTLLFVFCSIFAAMAQTSAVPPRIAQAVDEQQLVRLTGTVHPLAQAQYDRGAAPDDMPLDRIHLVLKRSPAQESALRQFISDAHRPGSASYHKWLTPEQFGQQFGPSDQDIATIASWLGSHGFQVAKVQPGKQVLEFSGNVAQMRAAFHTQIHKYVVNGETHHANASDPQIPAALAPVVGGFVSLNNFRPKSHTHVLGKATFDTKTHTAQPEWTYGPLPGGGVLFPLAPADFAIQYDLNPLYSANPAINGAGQTIAVIENSNINVDLVNLFRTLFNLPANPPQIIIDGNDPGIDGINNADGPSFSSFEAYLDFEWSGAVAPAATIDLVIAADTALEAGVILAAEHAVYYNIAPVMSLSFGFCEAGLGSFNTVLNNLWEQAAAQGTTVVVSAGDSGSAGCDDFTTQYYAVDGLAVSGFASTPFNVAVGGTDFFYSDPNTQIPNDWNTTPSPLPQASIKGVIPEQPWNDSQYGLDVLSYYGITGATTIAAGSGGASACATGTPAPATPLQISGSCAGYPKPAWQTGTSVPNDKVRDLPDLSLFAADGANYSYYPLCAVDGDCQLPPSGPLVQISGAGGTSVSVQAFAGIMALVNQKYGRQGQANFVLYPLKAQFPSAFHDVLQGTNSVPCEFSPSDTANCIAVNGGIAINGPPNGAVTEGQISTGATPDYNAAAGYNLATGLGTIDANVLLNDWGNIKFASTNVSLTSPTAGTHVSHGTSVTFTGTVSGDAVPTGNVAIETDNAVPLNTFQSPSVLPLVGNGSFSGPINYLPGGTYNVWANYGGDTSNASSASPKVQITVTPEASTTYFNLLNAATPYSNAVATTNGATVPYGTQLILDAEPFPSVDFTACTTTNSCPSFTIPTGTVAFSDNGSVINTTVVNAEGDAEFNAPWPIGAHSVTAAYSGDASYSASNAGPITFTINKNTVVIYLSSAAQTATNTYQGGQTTVFTIQVENSANLNNETRYNIGFSNPTAAPTGTVTLSGNNLPPGLPNSPVSLSPAVDPATFSPDGVATIAANIPAGSYNVTINYSGDSNYLAPLVAPSFPVKIVGATGLPSTTAASIPPGSVVSPTASIAVSGTVTGQNGSPAPTGNVLFFSSGYVLGEVTVTAVSGDVSSFSATLNSQDLFQGTNLITVQYLGDKNYSQSSTTLNVASPLSDFSMVPAATIVPVSPGGPVVPDTISVSSVNGFSGNVSFNCSAPTGISCPSPSSVNLSNSGSGATTLQISASSSTASFTVGGPITVVAGSSGAAPAVTPYGSILLTATSGSFVHTLAIAIASAVQVSCPAATLPPGVTCSPNPVNLNVNSSSLPTGQLALNVAAPSAPGASAELLPAARIEYASLQGRPRYRNGWWKLSAGSGLAAMFLLFLPGRRRYRATLGLWLICVLSFAMGCGGGSSAGGVVGGTAATPSFSPGAGTYGPAQSVTITSATSGATICYTTNGTPPTATTPGTCSTGTTLANGGAVTVSVSETLEAIATESGFSNSGVATAAYTVGATTTKITAPVTKAAKGTGLNFNVAVTLQSSATEAGNGMVELVANGSVVATVAAANGVATFTNITSLPVGTNSISASYQGDANTLASQSGNVNVTVTGTTQVPIKATSGPLVVNGAINLTIM